VREGEKSDFRACGCNGFHIWFHKTDASSGVAFETGEYVGHFFPGIGAGSDGDNLGIRMAKNEPEELKPRVAAGSDDRDFGNSRHLEWLCDGASRGASAKKWEFPPLNCLGFACTTEGPS